MPLFQSDIHHPKVPRPGLWEILTSVLEVKAALLLRQATLEQIGLSVFRKIHSNINSPLFLVDKQPHNFCLFVHASATAYKYVARIDSCLKCFFVVQVAYREPALD
jgi:hypothetical protein